MHHAVWVEPRPHEAPLPPAITGWTVASAHSVAEAQRRHGALPFDAIVLPPVAAAIDGLSAVLELRRWEPSPAIVLRVDDDSTRSAPLVTAALEAGAHELLPAGIRHADPICQALEIALHRRRSNQLAIAQIAKADARADAMAAYGSAVSHDLRSPLTTLVGIAETFERCLTEPGDIPIEMLVTMARRASLLGREALRHTDELLEDAEVDATQLVELDLDRLAAEAWQLVDRPDVTIVIEAAIDGVFGLKASFRQILHNLLANAARHCGEDRGVVMVDVEPATTVMRVRVHDNGPGVPRERRHEIFERGVSESSSGLGLATVRRQLSRIGGRVWVGQSDALGGAMFVAEVPVPGARAPDPSAN